MCGTGLATGQLAERPQEKPASQREAAMPVAGIAEGPKRDALPLKVASTPADPPSVTPGLPICHGATS